MEPWPNAWIVVVGIIIVAIAALYVNVETRNRTRAATWAIVVENERRQERANAVFPEVEHFTVTVTDDGLVVRMEPLDSSGESISFFPDVTKRGEIVEVGSGGG